MPSGNDAENPAAVANHGPDEFRELADHAPVMIWRSGTDMLCEFFNRNWLGFTGRALEQELGMGWAEGVHPDDYDRCLATYVAAFRAREPFSMEYRLRRHNGAYGWVLNNGAPFERDGAFAGYFGSCIDIDGRKRIEENQRRLLGELNHRVKNMLASVQAIAYQTFREAEARGAYSAFLGRLQAMGAAHDLVSGGDGSGADLAAIIDHTARPHIEESERFRLAGGEPVWTAPKRVLALTLCLHELFTNARQHGALSGEVGRVDLDWTVDAERVRLRWVERGGPVVGTVRSGGFGLRLIRTLGREGGGEVRFSFPPEGFTCEIAFSPDAPLPRPGSAPLRLEG